MDTLTEILVTVDDVIATVDQEMEVGNDEAIGIAGVEIFNLDEYTSVDPMLSAVTKVLGTSVPGAEDTSSIDVMLFVVVLNSLDGVTVIRIVSLGETVRFTRGVVTTKLSVGVTVNVAVVSDELSNNTALLVRASVVAIDWGEDGVEVLFSIRLEYKPKLTEDEATEGKSVALVALIMKSELICIAVDVEVTGLTCVVVNITVEGVNTSTSETFKTSDRDSAKLDSNMLLSVVVVDIADEG